MHHIKVNLIEQHLPNTTKYNVHHVKFVYNELYLDNTQNLDMICSLSLEYTYIHTSLGKHHT